MMRMLLTSAFLAGSIVAGIGGATPATAQTQDRIIDVFGNDPCPSSNGEGIVVCRRLPAPEKYRIPKDLRDAEADQKSLTWANKVQSVEFTGKSGTNSCSPAGAGGETGCELKMIQQAKAEKRAQAKSDAGIP